MAVRGDFNEILWTGEKKGGQFRITQSMGDFRNTFSNLNLQDLGFIDHKFTWTNGHSGNDNIPVRLDRAVANPWWRRIYPATIVTHFGRF